jgi:hypothetical protein
MKTNRNEILVMLTAISIFACVDLFPQRATQDLRNPRIISTEKSREKVTTPEKTKTITEVLDRKKAETPNRVNSPSTDVGTSSRETTYNEGDVIHDYYPIEIEETVKRRDTRLLGNLEKRRITPKRVVHRNRPIYVEKHTNYRNPFYFTCRTFPLGIANVYPHFPLRFVSANIDYLYSKKNNYRPFSVNYFEVNVSVLVTNNYLEEFGVLVQYPNGSDQIILFNEDEIFLAPGKIYNFSKIVALQDTGNINLRVGYYDSFSDSFYPAVYSRNETDLSIRVRL